MPRSTTRRSCAARFSPGDNHYFLARSSAVGASQLLGVIDAAAPGGPKADQSRVHLDQGDPRKERPLGRADPVFNQVYVPIPAGNSTVCGSVGGNEANGCIAVFTTPNDDPRIREGRRPDTTDSGDAITLGLCPGRGARARDK